MKIDFSIALFLILTFMSNVYAANLPDAIPGEYIVKFKDSASFDFKSLQGIQLQEVFKTEWANLALIKVSDDQAINILKENPQVELIEPNYIWRINSRLKIPNDPKFKKQWGLRNKRWGWGKKPDINALKAWDHLRKYGANKEIVIAVIDSGINYKHKDLKANIWTNPLELNGKKGVDEDGNGFFDDIYGYDFVNVDGDPMDDNGHGTHCAGVIGAVHNNKIGIAGVMYNIKLMGLKFINRNGQGTTMAAIKAIEYATKQNVDVMSNSWGSSSYSRMLENAIKNASRKGIMFVAAAGNDSYNNDNRSIYPSSYKIDNVVSVGAIKSNGKIAEFSNFGKQSVHVMAPGDKIYSTYRGLYTSLSGTSMAAPHVAGMLGLLIQFEGKRPLPLEARNRIIQTSVRTKELNSYTVSKGRVDAYRLLSSEKK